MQGRSQIARSQVLISNNFRANRKSISLLCVCAFLAAEAAAQAPPSKEHAKFDALRLKTGIFLYRDMEGGRDLGKSQIVIEQIRRSDKFQFSTVVTGKFSQQWVAMTTSTFEPISASLSFGEGAPMPAFDLTYGSGRVKGFVVERHGPTAGAKRPVNDPVPPAIVDQRVDWAAVSASDFESNPNVEFEVYDPALGVSHVLARRGSLESISVPAGEFEVYVITYEIRKRTGTATYKAFVTKDEPRVLVREDFPDGSQGVLASISSNRGDGGSMKSPQALTRGVKPSVEQFIPILKAAYAAFNRGDLDLAVASFDPHIEWTEPAEFPGGGAYHGRDEARRYLAQSRDGSAEVISEPERFIPSGDKIVVLVHARVRPKDSSEWQDVRLADVYTVREGKAVAMHAFADRQEALRWAGIKDASR